ncbi:MAG: hypothetical protein N3A59_03680 [Thermodesulfovibrionales bacterium]|nr:hypothetical protein [Thermodesulfovibrionales bacterium]
MNKVKISFELVVGLIITIISAYYWSEIGSDFTGSSKLIYSEIPLFFRYTFRLFPFADFTITVIGMVLFYTGLKKLRSQSESF